MCFVCYKYNVCAEAMCEEYSECVERTGVLQVYSISGHVSSYILPNDAFVFFSPLRLCRHRLNCEGCRGQLCECLCVYEAACTPVSSGHQRGDSGQTRRGRSMKTG